MKLKVDHKNDALYFRLDESAIVESEEIKPGVILDYDVNDNIVGIEILDLSKRVSVDMLANLQIETVYAQDVQRTSTMVESSKR